MLQFALRRTVQWMQRTKSRAVGAAFTADTIAADEESFDGREVHLVLFVRFRWLSRLPLLRIWESEKGC